MSINYSSLKPAVVGTPPIVKILYRAAVNSVTGNQTLGQTRAEAALPYQNKELRIQDQLLLLNKKFEKVDVLDFTTDYYHYENNILLLGKFIKQETVNVNITRDGRPYAGTAEVFTFENEGKIKKLSYAKEGDNKKRPLTGVYKLKTEAILDDNDKIIMQESGIYEGGKKLVYKRKNKTNLKKNKLRKTNRKSKR